MIFGWRTVLIIGFIVPIVYWIIWNNEEYTQLFTNPKGTWIKMEWWKVLMVSIPTLLIFLKFAPLLEQFLAENLGSLVTSPEQTSQSVVTEHAAQIMGVRWGLLLSGAFFAVIACFEEVIWRGVILHYFQKRWNQTFALAISSLLFGISHLSEVGFGFPFMIYVTIVGVIFGTVYLKTGLLGAVITHSGYNFCVMLLLALNL